MRSLELLDKKYSELLALGEELMREVSDSDASASDHSSYGGPPAIRTRNISVTTAATSITSREKGTGSPFTSVSTSPRTQEPLKSWLDSDLEDLPSAPCQSCTPTSLEPEPPAVLPRRRSSARHARGHNSLRSRESRSPELGTSGPFAYFTNSMDGPDDTITALPPPSGPYDTSASRMLNYEAERLVAPGSWERTVVPRKRGIGSPRSPPSPSCFIPATGLADVTPTKSQSWLAHTSRSRSTSVANHRPTEDIPEDAESYYGYSDVSSSLEHPSSPSVPGKARPQSVSIETWFQTVIDDFAHPLEPEVDAPASKMRLPAEVLETLRVSVSCFPETMLLCSSLSIETIRSHARKLKYEGNNHPDFSSGMTELSFSPEEKPKSSAWKKFTSLGRKTQTADASQQKHNGVSAGSSQHMTNFGLEKEVSTWPRSSPDWASIRSVFPNGTDYLCDALYAHLLAFNCIDTLCPRGLSSPTAPPMTPRPQTATTNRGPSSPRPSSSGTQSSSRIPRKAASLLGLQNDSNEDEPVPPVPALPLSRVRGDTVLTTVSRANTVSTMGRNTVRGKRSYALSTTRWNAEEAISTGSPSAPRTPVIKQQRSFIGNVSASEIPADSQNQCRSGQQGTASFSATTTKTGSSARFNNSDKPAPKLTTADQTLVDLRAGLMKCISRLVVTLQTTSSSGYSHHADGNNEEQSLHAIASLDDDGCTGLGDPQAGLMCTTPRSRRRQSREQIRDDQNRRGNMNGGSANGAREIVVEPFLMRALCELVRVAEQKVRD